MPGFPSHPADRRFYAAVSVVASAVIVTGFASTYGPKVVTGSRPVPTIVHIHAGVFACWLVLFVAQTLLVLRGRIRASRGTMAPSPRSPLRSFSSGPPTISRPGGGSIPPT